MLFYEQEWQGTYQWELFNKRNTKDTTKKDGGRKGGWKLIPAPFTILVEIIGNIFTLVWLN